MNCNACGLPILPGETAVALSYGEWYNGIELSNKVEKPRLVFCSKCGEQIMIEAPIRTDTAGFRIYIDREVRDEWISPRSEPVDFTDMLTKVMDYARQDPYLRCIVISQHEDPKQLRITVNQLPAGFVVLAYSKVSRSLVMER